MSNDDLYEDYRAPADRFLLAQTWWIASELVRRHPHLRIGTVLTDDNCRLVIVHDEPDGYRVQFDLVSGAKYMLAGELHSISWIEMMSAPNAHEIVKRLEIETGLGVPMNTPASTPKALVYRIIASALTSGVNDRHDWYAEEVQIDFETDLAEHPILSSFPGTADVAFGHLEALLADAGERGGVFYQPLIALMRDQLAVAVFDVAGFAHTSEGVQELMPVYRATEHKLTLTTMQVVGPWLP